MTNYPDCYGETEMTKLCKDCKHYRKDWISYIFPFFGAKDDYDMCGRKKNDNLVTGKNNLSFCDIERRDYSALDVCGIEAKYFEARK